MGRHSKNNDNNDGNASRDAIRTMLEFDAEAARLDAEYAKKRERMGSVEQATADAEIKRASWGRRKK